MAAEQAKVAKALEMGVRLQRTDSVACNPKMQGDIAMLDPKMMQLRNDLKKNPRIHSTIYGWWKTLSLDEDAEMGQEQYTEINIALHLMLDPSAKHTVLVKTANEDWRTDVRMYANGKTKLSFAGFYEAMFQICDTWVDTTEEEDYDLFANKLHAAHSEYAAQTAGMNAAQQAQLLTVMDDLVGEHRQQFKDLMQKLTAEEKVVALDVLAVLDTTQKAVFTNVLAGLDDRDQKRLTNGMHTMSAREKTAVLNVMPCLDEKQQKQMLDTIDDLNEEYTNQLVMAMESMSSAGQAAILDVMEGFDTGKKASLMEVMANLSEQDQQTLAGE
jgi:hypothetical protein